MAKIHSRKHATQKRAPLWQLAERQTFHGDYLRHYANGSANVGDLDPYDAALRKGANRLAHQAGIEIRCAGQPQMDAAGMLREAALLLDLMTERQRARETARKVARHG